MNSGPASGAAVRPAIVDVTAEAIDIPRLIGSVSDPSAGGTAVFIGTSRSPSGGKAVAYLEYEAYRPMAIKTIETIVERAFSKWPLVGVGAIHRTGRVEVGEPSVVVVVSSVHRGEAFEACRFVIDALKKEAPIWKKEVFAGGEGAEWAGP